jgi:NADPH2:quinone reductase
VTVVLDANGGGGDVGARAFELLAAGGRFLIFGFSSGSMTSLDPARVAERGIKNLSYFGPPAGPSGPEVRQRRIRDVLAAAAAGRLRTIVGARFPLEKAAAEHAAIDARETVGKAVLEP